MLKQAQTRLVALGGSASQVLAVELLPYVNVISRVTSVSAKAMANWVQTFYQSLTKNSLAEAAELATSVSQAPMRLYFQQKPAEIIVRPS